MTRRTEVIGGRYFFTARDDNNVITERKEAVFRTSSDPGGDHLIEVQILDVLDSNKVLGDPIRLKSADGRIAADFPNVSPTYFITEGGVDGPITNG